MVNNEFVNELDTLKFVFESPKADYFVRNCMQPTDVEFFDLLLEVFSKAFADETFANCWLDYPKDDVSISLRIENNEISYNFVVRSNDYFGNYLVIPNNWEGASEICIEFEKLLQSL